MYLKSIEPFVPSGGDFQASRSFFLEFGFAIRWETDDYVGFEKDGCKFILQKYNDRNFAENFMVRVAVESLDDFWRQISAKDLPARFDVSLSEPTDYPWGREVNLIDLAGVCWHFAEAD